MLPMPVRRCLVLRSLILGSSLLLFTALGCKSTGRAHTASWELDGSEAKAQEFIVGTVNKNFPDLATDQSEIIRFARGLMDQKESHAESADYVLGKVQTHGTDALERYIVLEFASSTNVIEAVDSKVALRYLGPAPSQADTQ